MLKKQSKQKDFFDSYVYEHLLPPKHILLDILNTIDFSFVDNCVKDLYSDSMGRPSFPPETLFKMLFLEFFCDLSDYDVVDHVKTNVLFRYFAGLGISNTTPDHATLSMFRKRLGEDRFKRLFNRVVLQAKKKGLINGKLKILDSTHIEGNITIQSAVNMLRHGRKVVIKKISKVNPRTSENLKKKFLNKKKMCNPPSKEETKEEVEITKDFIKKVKDKFSNEGVREVIDLLEIALGQQQRKADNPKHKEPDEIVSLSDEDARRGVKSKTKRFVGYKGNISMDEGSNIVTSADTIPGNRNEGNKDTVKGILKDDKSKGIKHEAVAADSLYDSYDNRKNIHKQHMRAFITRTKSKLDNFIYDNKKDTLICPEGYSPPRKYRQDNRDLFYFPAKICKKCRNAEGCPRSKRGRVLVTLSDNYRLFLIDDIPERKEVFVKRKTIERKFGEAKVWHGLSRARYRKRARVAIQVFMTFIVTNIKRMVKLLLASPEYALCKTGYG